jgi:hypothetical protein
LRSQKRRLQIHREVTEAGRHTCAAAEGFKRHAQLLPMPSRPHRQDHPGNDGCGRPGEILDSHEAHAQWQNQFASQPARSLALAPLIEDAGAITTSHEHRTETLAL